MKNLLHKFINVTLGFVVLGALFDISLIIMDLSGHESAAVIVSTAILHIIN